MYSIEAETSRTARLYPAGHTQGYARVIAPETWVYAEADGNSARQSQYTYGETLRLLARHGDYCHTQSLRDAYSGWVHQNSLQPLESEPQTPDFRTRHVAPVTREPSLKSAYLLTLPPDAAFNLDGDDGDYLHIAGLGWIHHLHVIAAQTTVDTVMTAAEHLGRSYVWGGRGIAGLDCSALAQLCYRRAGRNIPRDSDLQAHFLKKFHDNIPLSGLRSGDLIYIPGHVMIAATPESVIHATAHHMQVVHEMLDTVLARYRLGGGTDDGIAAYRWRG